MYQVDKGTNGVYSLHYHFITCIKYRRKVFVRDDIIRDIKDIMEQVSQEYGLR